MVRSFVTPWFRALRFAQAANRARRLSAGDIQRLLGPAEELN